MLSDHDDFFRGHGIWTAAWKSPLINISRRAQQDRPAEHTSPAFKQILAVSSIAPLPSWWHFSGRWGPDRDGLTTALGTIYWAQSATGPWAKVDFGDFGQRARDYQGWKTAHGKKLEIYADAGLSIPRARPLPLPVVR